MARCSSRSQVTRPLCCHLTAGTRLGAANVAGLGAAEAAGLGEADVTGLGAAVVAELGAADTALAEPRPSVPTTKKAQNRRAINPKFLSSLDSRHGSNPTHRNRTMTGKVSRCREAALGAAGRLPAQLFGRPSDSGNIAHPSCVGNMLKVTRRQGHPLRGGL